MEKYNSILKESKNFRKGDAVLIPYNGSMVSGIVVRYDKGDYNGTPFYIVDIGKRQSERVPEHKVESYEDADMYMYESNLEEAKKKGKTKVKSPNTFDKIVKKVEEFTWNNQHNWARLEWATYFKLKDHIKIYNAIIILHETEGHMPHKLTEYRNEVDTRMYEYIEQKQGKEVLEKVYTTM